MERLHKFLLEKKKSGKPLPENLEKLYNEFRENEYKRRPSRQERFESRAKPSRSIKSQYKNSGFEKYT